MSHLTSPLRINRPAPNQNQNLYQNVSPSRNLSFYPSYNSMGGQQPIVPVSYAHRSPNAPNFNNGSSSQ